MKCLNCGQETDLFLCGSCQTEPILDKVFNEIRFFKPDTCKNPHLLEYASALTEKYEERNCIPEILDLFDFEISEFYYCQYYRMCRDSRFEEAAKAYLAVHNWEGLKSQRIIYDLLESYLREDFVQPRQWCDWITETNGLCCELYANAAQYYSMVGEYDLADSVTDSALAYCADPAYDNFLFYSKENMVIRLEKQKTDTLRYRTKKPYWPSTESRRRAVAMFYDEKGIKYPRIESRPEKVRESEFEPINECFDEGFTDYCAFWCAETFSLSAAKGIYQIAAVKVRDGQITEEFQSLIRPWDGIADRKDAARKAKVELAVIESAEDVDQVIPKFFAFVGDDILVSTGALGNQTKLLVRAARYAGMKAIPNELYDLLDLAADTDAEFDLANNTREYLLQAFGFAEGEDALGKAKNNFTLYNALCNYGE